MSDPLLWQLVLQLCLIALNAVFACAEIAVITMNDARLAQLASEGDKRAMRLARLTSEPARFLATIQVAITLSGFLGSAIAADNFSDRLAAWAHGLMPSVPLATLDGIALVVITLILSYFTLVFGELVPKRLAMKNAEKLALGISGLVSFLSKLFAPVVALLTVSTDGVLRLFGIDPTEKDDNVSEEEILMMVDVGSANGSIDESEKEIINNLFEFDDTTVSEFATHRTNIAVLYLDESDAEWAEAIGETRHTLYPVCGESIDDVVGILNIKDYYLCRDEGRKAVLEKAVRPACFVPESLKADVLFTRMKRTRDHFAVVLDEYGGMMGIVTMNDLLEQLVGDLGAPEDETEIELAEGGAWHVRGSADLEAVAERLHVPLPTDEYDTFGGFVFGLYGSIPEDGDTIELDAGALHIRVDEIRAHRVERATVCVNE